VAIRSLVVSGADNLAYVKPAKAGAETNLNLVTASGTVYSFLLTEGTAPPDLKLYVVADDELASSRPRAQYYTAADVDALRRAADDAKKAADEATATATKQTGSGCRRFARAIRSPSSFRIDRGREAAVSCGGHLYRRHVHVHSRAHGELPALYEIRDGAPNLVNFQVEHVVYVVPKVLERGYLAMGKQRFLFESKR